MNKYAKNAKAPRWTESEIERLRELCKSGVSYDDIAKILNRSRDAIIQKSSQFSIKQNQPRCVFWSDEEEDKLVSNYHILSITELKKLFPTRSENSIKGKAKQLGLLGRKFSYRKWTDDDYELLERLYNDGYGTEFIARCLDRDPLPVDLKLKPLRGRDLYWKEEDINLLKKHYSTSSKEELSDMFPHKEYYLIGKKAREIGLSRPLNLLWKHDELEVLKSNYSNHTIRELLFILPNKTKNQINNKAKSLGLRKNKNTLAKCLRLKHKIDLNNISFSHEKNASWRRQILKRDKYTCQECGLKDKSGQELQAHHIIPKRDCNNKQKYDINNGIMLCIECHKKTINKEYKYANKYISLVG